MRKVTVHQAKTHLSRLLREVEAGEVILICRGDVEVARLAPLHWESKGVKENKKAGFETETPKTPKQKAWGLLKDKLKPVSYEAATSPPFTDEEWDEIFAEDEARNGPL
jgi:antitoxin (DNA-binding transcriptional repressor) of toxin-antitoxin stability system